ncbi:hypothetical protein [Zophobihabitans entericus]|uniref:Uncharacterized protein n=1 Tax=Zophobihabitans entericus TaxID=1635327 RepID=A0A6G9IAI8_9GAMM|nr:hypothetical protein [Zophobihabitans entericus]QIQ20847.1 hypothetical protein IPMB12_03630 [Zophobihabitans entericus]
MTFTQAVTNFAKSLPGTDSYVNLRNAMQTLIKDDSANAAVYFLIFGFARTYVMLYEDQEVSPQFAEDNQKLMLSYLNTLNAALQKSNAAELYQAMNDVVVKYEESKKVF